MRTMTMTPQFDEEELKDLRVMIQLIRDYRAWGRLREYAGKTVLYLAGIGAFFTFFKRPLFLAMGWDE